MPYPAFPGAEVAPPDAPHQTGAAGGPPGGPGSSGGADAVFACAAHGADSTKGGMSVLHCYLFNIPRAGLGPALQTVDFNGFEGVAIIEGSCSGGCQDYSQKKPSRRMRLQDRSDRPVIAL